MASGAAVKKRRRDALSAMQGGRCCYCGTTTDDSNPWGDLYPTFEHIHDRARGGPNALHNLAIACRGCNERAGREGWPVHFKRAKIEAANVIALSDLTVEHMELPPEYLKRAGRAA